MSVLPVFACLQPILIACITPLLFAFLPFQFSLIVYLLVVAYSHIISLMICAPKGRWWLLIMTLNQAAVYAVKVLMMHFSTCLGNNSHDHAQPAPSPHHNIPCHAFLSLYILISSAARGHAYGGVFAWISARWTQVVTTVLFGCARWTSDRCTDFLEHQELGRKSRLPTYQVSLTMISNFCISDLYIHLASIAYG